MDMPIPTPSPYSDESEGPVLRNFVNESIAHERQQSPRSQHLAQNYEGEGPIDPGPSRQRHELPISSQELIDTDGSANELLRLVTKQKQEIRSLRNALHVVKDRADSDAQRLVSVERTKTTENFRLLNEDRLTAQQEALKANSESRLYQFQLENAQREITKTQSLLKTVQNQRDDAEEAAARARRKVRKYLQEKMVAAAREEGRKIGFKAGLQRAQEEQVVYSSVRRGRTRTSRKRLEEPGQLAGPEIPDPIARTDLSNAALEEEVDILLSQRLDRPNRRQDTPPEGTRAQQISKPGPTEEDEMFENDSPPPPEPAPLVYPTSNLARPTTPSVLSYPITIPPASEIERQNSLNKYPDNQPRQWVTAQQYHQLTGQQATSPYGYQSNTANVDLSRGEWAVGQPPQPGKRKESWYRKLSRSIRRRRKPIPQDGGFTAPNMPIPVQPSPRGSWYTPASNRPPPVIARDFVTHQTQPSADSVSTRLSQLELVSPPPDGSESSLKLKGRRKRREKGPLYVINEDLDATPMKQRDASQIYQPDAKIPQVMVTPFVESDSRYPHPKTLSEWRTSSASVPREMNDLSMPLRGPRRPANLTVPAPLAQGVTASQLYASQHSGSGNESQGNAPPLFRRGTSSELSPIGIRVEGPSRSPSDAPGSSHLENNFLSPHRVPGNLPSMSSLAGISESPSPSGPRPTSGIHGAPGLYQTEPTQNDGYSSSLGLTQAASRPGSATDHIQTFPPSLNYPVQPLPPDYRPPSQQWPNDGYLSRPPDRPTPKQTNQPLSDVNGGSGDRRSRSVGQQTPRHSVPNPPATITNDDGWGAGTSGGWGGTVRSDGSHKRVASDVHRTPTQTPRGSVHNLPAANEWGGGWGGTARSDGSHKRAASDARWTPNHTPRGSTAIAASNIGWGGTARSDGSQKDVGAGPEVHLTPGPSGYAGLPRAADDEKAIHRVSSNLSMRSAGSQYAKFNSSNYVDPAFYASAELVEPNMGKLDKGKGVDKSR